MSDSFNTVEKPIGEEPPITSTDDQETSDRRKKKPWQWTVDAVVWAACVAALCLALLTPDENSRFLRYTIESIESEKDSTDYITDTANYSYENLD